MESWKSICAATAVAISAVAAPAAADGLAMAPKQGISFDVGASRAVAYYLQAGGICNLTVLMADRAALDEVKGAATRVTIPVIPTRAARIDTAEGKTLEFKCAPAAAAVAVKVLDQVAYADRK